MWWRILTGLLLLGHGFVHAVWRTYGPRTSWAMGSEGEVSTTLFVSAAVGFFAAGLGVLIQRKWWRPLAVVSSVVSLLFLLLFWSPMLVVGLAIDLAIVILLPWRHWPPEALVGS